MTHFAYFSGIERAFAGWRSCAFIVSMFLVSLSLRVQAQETKTFIAFSMREAQKRVELATTDRQGFRGQSDLFYLGGITVPRAIVVDLESGDWILLGERDPEASLLSLDDWVVALRARYFHPESDPGVTIDPIPSDECRKAGTEDSCRTSSRQKVRFFSGIQDTNFGQVCYSADWLMKLLAFGLDNVPVDGFKSRWALALEKKDSSTFRNSFTSVRLNFRETL